MATQWTFDDPIPFAAEKVWALIIDPKFMERWTLVQGGQNPRAEVFEDADDRYHVRMYLKEPVNIPFLQVMIDAQMEFRWRRSQWMGEWKRIGPSVDVWGTTHVIAESPDRCRFQEKGNVSFNGSLPAGVQLPYAVRLLGQSVLGGKVESGVVDHLKAGRKKKLDFLLEELRKGG